jgi:hypothetical protein
MIVFLSRASEGLIEDDTMTSFPRGLWITFLTWLVASQSCWADEPPAKSGDRGEDRAAIIAGIKRRGGWVKPGGSERGHRYISGSERGHRYSGGGIGKTAMRVLGR